MAARDDTWVIIPVYNEDQVIGQVVKDLLPTFPHVVCIDDGSRDKSAAVAAAAGATVM
ncbi:glycosyltransferase, partial [Varibaculum cambriense]|uniref:glycosyltransferase n=1 Tax=Varibaculum cambriense TaxID=184870 RepID=UPI000571E4D3